MMASEDTSMPIEEWIKNVSSEEGRPPWASQNTPTNAPKTEEDSHMENKETATVNIESEHEQTSTSTTQSEVWGSLVSVYSRIRLYVSGLFDGSISEGKVRISWKCVSVAIIYHIQECHH